MNVVEFQSTPNPNAVKCIVDKPTGREVRSYFSAEQAKGDALAELLFSIPGVTNLLIQPDWITVSKSPGAEWDSVKEGVKKALANASVS